jgi:polysaccharide biosynthesis/export protein
MKQILSIVFAICMLSAVARAQDGSGTVLSKTDRTDAEKQSAQGGSLEPDEYVIGPEDVLSIVVWDEMEFTNKVIVRPDGKIGIPLLNDVHAGGLTPRQLQEALTKALERFVAGPRVSVIVEEIRSHVVYVTGAVARSGVIPLGGPMTIMELLIRAGGLSEFAKAEEIQILRKEGDKLRRYRFNYKTFIEGKDYQQNIRIRNGDMVIVP